MSFEYSSERESWTDRDDPRLRGAKIVGRAGIFRQQQSDLEPNRVRAATGLMVELKDGTRWAVYWERTGDHSTSYFALVPPFGS